MLSAKQRELIELLSNSSPEQQAEIVQQLGKDYCLQLARDMCEEVDAMATEVVQNS